MMQFLAVRLFDEDEILVGINVNQTVNHLASLLNQVRILGLGKRADPLVSVRFGT